MSEFTGSGLRLAVLNPDANIPKLVLGTWASRSAKPTGNRERGTVNGEL